MPTQDASDASKLPWIVVGSVATAAVVYLALFFSVRIGDAENGPLRLSLLLLYTTPDDVVANAVGRSFQWEGVWHRLWTLGATAAMLWCAVWLGWWPLAWLKAANDRPWWERCLFAAGLGLHLISLLTLAVGLAGLLQTPTLLVLLGIAAIVSPIAWLWHSKGVGSLFRPMTSQVQESAAEKDSRPRLWWFAAVAGIFAAIILLGAALPPWDFDVREYHLQVPKEWYQAGRIDFLPHNMYANMPLSAELLPLAAMSVLSDWWLGAIVGKTVMGACALLTAGAVYGLVRRFASPLAALVAALVWLSHPWAIHVSISGLNEQVYALYFTLAVSVVAVNDASWRNWLLCGLLAGAAAACKYPAVVMAAVPLAAWAVIAPRIDVPLAAPWRLRAAALVVFVAGAALSGGAWYVKNWVQAGNPVYPLLGNILDGRTRTPAKNDQFARGHAVPPYTAEKLGQSLARIGWQSEHQSPLLVPLVLLGLAALGARWYERTETMTGGAGVPLVIGIWSLVICFLALWWLATHRLDRFLVPIIPLAAVIAGAGLQWAILRPHKWAIYPLLAIGLLYNLAYVCWPMPLAALAMAGDNRWLMSLNDLRHDEPRENSVSRINADVRWLNANVPAGQAVLCVGEAAVFDLEMPVYYHTCFDDCLLVEWMAGKTAAERKQFLAEKRIAFVHVDWVEIERYRAPGNYGFDPRFSQALLDELVAQRVLGPPLPHAPPQLYPVLP